MKRFRFFLVLLGVFLSLASFGQSCKIEKIWLEFQKVNNGESGFEVHVNFNITDCKGVSGSCNVYLHDEKQYKWTDQNNNNCATDKQVCFSRSIKPKYDVTYYNDFIVFVPNTEIHMRPGEHTYYIKVQIYSDKTESFLAKSDYVKFIGTGPDINGFVGVERILTNTEETIETETINENGTVTRTLKFPCGACKKTGICSICHGYAYVYGLRCTCGTGKCFYCKGTGYTTIVSTYSLAEYINSYGLVIDFDHFRIDYKNGISYSGRGGSITLRNNNVIIQTPKETAKLPAVLFSVIEDANMFNMYQTKNKEDGSVPILNGISMKEFPNYTIFLFMDKDSPTSKSWKKMIGILYKALYSKN